MCSQLFAWYKPWFTAFASDSATPTLITADKSPWFASEWIKTPGYTKQPFQSATFLALSHLEQKASNARSIWISAYERHLHGGCLNYVHNTHIYIYILHWETHQLLLQNKSMCSDDEKHEVRVAFGFCRKMGWFRCDVGNVPPVTMWLVAPWEERKRRRGWAASSTSFGLGLWYWCWEH